MRLCAVPCGTVFIFLFEKFNETSLGNSFFYFAIVYSSFAASVSLSPSVCTLSRGQLAKNQM